MRNITGGKVAGDQSVLTLMESNKTRSNAVVVQKHENTVAPCLILQVHTKPYSTHHSKIAACGVLAIHLAFNGGQFYLNAKTRNESAFV